MSVCLSVFLCVPVCLLVDVFAQLSAAVTFHASNSPVHKVKLPAATQYPYICLHLFPASHLFVEEVLSPYRQELAKSVKEVTSLITVLLTRLGDCSQANGEWQNYGSEL